MVAPGEHVPQDAPADIVLKDFPLVIIRGPFVAEVGPAATVETSVDGNVVGLRQGKILATAFHPELTDDNPHPRAVPEFVACSLLQLAIYVQASRAVQPTA